MTSASHFVFVFVYEVMEYCAVNRCGHSLGDVEQSGWVKSVVPAGPAERPLFNVSPPDFRSWPTYCGPQSPARSSLVELPSHLLRKREFPASKYISVISSPPNPGLEATPRARRIRTRRRQRCAAHVKCLDECLSSLTMESLHDRQCEENVSTPSCPARYCSQPQL